ncbi:hypothetical protein PEBR_11698 [Penicillium brasilianum]|uniref:Uncharacterized protein n=1 Tax=Penicillium brasilianum TaxID=104259 RepID=A0A1S9RTL8_PENBI|nr:hypothetical protein PEBR_11698 [Penicillium brasilianum]
MVHLNNDGQGPLQVPGFGNIPLDFELPPEIRFAHGLVDYRHSPRLTKREMAMLRLMQRITEIPEWHRTILDGDDKELAQWHKDAVDGPEGFLISDLAWDWCISELRDKGKIWQRTGRWSVFDNSSAVSQADLPELCLRDIQTQVARLGRQAEHDVPLVDPSLYPLVYDRSPVLTKGGQVSLRDPWRLAGEITEELPAHPFVKMSPRQRQSQITPSRRYGGPESCYSNRFQWLPCEIKFLNDDSLDVRITSYINNLNPATHRPLYGQLEYLISLSIPSWNNILFYGDTRGCRPPRILTYGCFVHNYEEDHKIFGDTTSYVRMARICKTSKEWQNVWDEVREYVSGPEPPTWQQAEPLPRFSPNLMDDVKPEEWSKSIMPRNIALLKRRRRAWFKHPEPGVSFSYEQWKDGRFTGRAILPQKVGKFPDPLDHHQIPIRLQGTSRQNGLQVVVEISRIELTPENPTYSGDDHFQTEGLRNDRIAASSVFVVEATNITQPRITFEHEDKIHAMELECKVPDAIATVFDVPYFEVFEETAPRALHVFGSIPLVEGRLLSWPNTFRSKRESFSLVDSNQPGNLTVIKLRLVDPHYRICSTQNVPPQQHDWWATEAQRALGLDQRLPPELVELVMKQTDWWPISRAEAERLREELHRDHERKQKAVDECVGHHVVTFLPYDSAIAIDSTDATGVYDSP